MNTKIAAVLGIVLAAAMLFGACSALPEAEDTSTAGPEPDNDEAIVVADIDGETVNRSEYLLTFESMCSSYGIDSSDEELAAIVGEMAINTLIYEKVMLMRLEELGYFDLSDEEEQQIRDEAQSEIDLYIETYYLSEIISGLDEDYTDEELEAATDELQETLLSEADITFEEYVDYFRNNYAVENAMEDLVGDVEPSEDELQAYYDEKLAEDQEAYAEAADYESAYQSGTVSYYIPEGLRMVRHVLIMIDEDAASEIYTLRYSEEDEEADAMLEEELEKIQTEADLVIEKLESEEITFDEAIEEYNDDGGMESYPEGYMICEDSTTYVDSFTEGAMSLDTIGEFTGLVTSDYGYHIIEYTSDVESETVSFEDVRDDIYEEMTPTMQEEAWAELVDEWQAEMEITIYSDEL